MPVGRRVSKGWEFDRTPLPWEEDSDVWDFSRRRVSDRLYGLSEGIFLLLSSFRSDNIVLISESLLCTGTYSMY